MKAFIFRALMLAPLIAIVGVPVYFVAFTNLPQLLYLQSIRNVPFDCTRFVEADYIYAMNPGPCRLANLEYDTVSTNDADGFRNPHPVLAPDVAVIGDSHSYGFGVGDAQTFASLIASEHHLKTRNLGIPSYATMRELETLSLHAPDARYVVIQYCDNDVGENEASLWMSKFGLRAIVETEWKKLTTSYHEGKQHQLRKVSSDLVKIVGEGSFVSRKAWRQSASSRDMDNEASLFARVLAKYRPLLEGKRLIVFESAGFGLNAPQFEAAFGKALRDLPWLSVHVLDSAKLLGAGDYYVLDDHLNPAGHAKLAATIAGEIARWEKTAPLIGAH